MPSCFLVRLSFQKANILRSFVPGFSLVNSFSFFARRCKSGARVLNRLPFGEEPSEVVILFFRGFGFDECSEVFLLGKILFFG